MLAPTYIYIQSSDILKPAGVDVTNLRFGRKSFVLKSLSWINGQILIKN
jgi:hypothetical protein